MKRARGFTLLEAIVAMVIFALVATSLLAWQGTNMRTIERVDAFNRRATLVREALALLQPVNPMSEADGSRRVGDIEVRWTGHPLAPEQIGKTQAGFPSAFNLQLFVLDVQVLRGGVARTRFAVRQVGWKEVRSTTDQ